MIELHQVSKAYRSGRGHVAALRGVSLTVGQGEVSIIAGKSGSGKTTLLNCVGGLERPDRGRIACAGVDVSGLSGRETSLFQRRRIGFVFQSGNLISYLTVRENLAFPLELNGITGRDRDHRIGGLLDLIGLHGTESALPHELSGGEVQRVAFARAISHGPSVLLVDEPTANLDSATGRQVIDMMKRLSRDRGCTLMIASHDPEVIESGDRRFFLKDGILEDRK